MSAKREAAGGTGEAPAKQGREIVLVRHTETEWSAEGRHTGRTDLPLTANGREAAMQLKPRLEGHRFCAVLVSPLRRARETCALCGFEEVAETRDALAEWDYGEYEGLTTAQIERRVAGWLLWRDGCPSGEDASQVGRRADGVIGELLRLRGDVLVFSHAHLLRVLGARWMELPPDAGGRLMLSTGSISVLGFEHGLRGLRSWNEAHSGE